MLLLLKNLLFTVFVPGTVAGLIPYLILSRRAAAEPIAWGPAQVLALALGGLGLGVYLWCLWDFATVGRATPAPIDPPRMLVVRAEPTSHYKMTVALVYENLYCAAQQ